MKFQSFFSRMGKSERQARSRKRWARGLQARVGLEELEVRNLPQATLPPVTVYNGSASGSAANVSQLPGLPTAIVDNQTSFSLAPGPGGAPLSGLSPSVAVDPINPDKIVAVASEGFNARNSNNGAQYGYVIVASVDGGYTWTVVAPAIIPAGGLLNLADPQDPTHVYAQNTDAQVTFDRSEQFYIVMDEHNATNTSGAIVLDKFNFSGPTPATITRDPLNTAVAPPLASNLFDKVIYKWDNTDAAFSPTVAIDNNDPTYTDPQTHLVQTDTLATMVPVTAAGTANLMGGGVSSVTLSARGLDYTAVPQVFFTSAPGDPGSGATGHAVLTGGQVTSVVIDNPGSGYLVPPTVTFTPGTYDNGLAVPKEVYVAWSTVDVAPTNTDPRFPGTPDDYNFVNEGPNKFNPDLVRLAGSADGGQQFTTPEDVTDAVAPGAISADYGTKTAAPQIVFTQGSSSGTVPGGEMAIVFQNLTYNVNGGAATGGGFLVDTSLPDHGVASKPAAESFVTSGTGGGIGDALPPPTLGPMTTNALDIPVVTTFPITVSVGDPNFVLDDMSVSLAMYAPHLNQISIELEAPDGTTVLLMNNFVSNQLIGNGDTKVNGNGTRLTGVDDQANLGIDNGTTNNTYNINQVTDVTFDQLAARAIDDPTGTGSHYLGLFRPDDRGIPSAPTTAHFGTAISGLFDPDHPSALYGSHLTDTSIVYSDNWTPNGAPLTGAHALNGTWTLLITDFVNDGGTTPPVELLDNWSLNLTGYINTNGFGTDSPVNGLDTLSHQKPTNNDIPPSATETYPDVQPVSPTTGIPPSFSVAVDNTLGSFSPHQGRIYVAAAVPDHLQQALQPGGLIPDDTNIEMVYSDDGGATWLGNGGLPTPLTVPVGLPSVASLPSIRISDDTINDGTEGTRPEFMPELAVDPTTGTVVATYMDARHDAARARVVTTVEYSTDGGQTWSPSTYLNPAQVATDAVTGATDIIGPVPTNIGLAGSLGIGDRQGLAVYGGHVYAFWSGNLNTAGATNTGINVGGFVLSTARATVPAGPSVISGDQGPVTAIGSTGTYDNTFTSDGTRQLSAFEVSLDRPVDPGTVNGNSLLVSYHSPTTPATDLSGQITSVTPLNLDTTSNLPSISLGDAITLESPGGTATAVFPVFLTSPLGADVTLEYTVTGITALQGVNYTVPAPGAGMPLPSVTIPAGSQVAFISIPIVYDPAITGNLTFVVNIEVARPPDVPFAPPAVELHKSTGIGTIVDANEPRNVAIGDGIALKATGSVGMVFTVVLNQAYFQNITLHYSTANGTALAGTDYVASSGSVTIPAGMTTGTITVPLIDNGVFAGNKTFTVTLDSPPIGVSISRTQATGTIINDTTIFPLSVYVGDTVATKAQTGLTNMYFPVVLSMAQPTAVVVTYSTSNNSAAGGRDYVTVNNGTVIFPAGQTTETITVQVIGSPLQEGNLDFFVNITGVSETTDPLTLLPAVINVGQADPSLPAGEARGTIIDSNIDPAVTIGNASVQALSTSNTTISFPVYLSIPSTQPVTFTYITLDGSAVAGTDYTAASGTITVAPGQTSTSITVQVLPDQKVANDVLFFVNIFGAFGATIANQQATGTIVDSPLGISIGDSSVSNPNTGTTTISFPVYLNGTTTQTVTVNYSTADDPAAAATGQEAKAGTNYVAVTNGSVTFMPGQTTATATVTVDGTFTQAPNNLVFLVNLTSATNGSVLHGQAVGTIIDTNAVPYLTIGNAVVTAGDKGGTAQNALVPVYLSFPVPQPVTVNYSTADGAGALGAKAGTDYTAANATASVTIAAGSSVGTITIPITSLPSNEEPDLTFMVNLGKVTSTRTGSTLPNAVVAPSPPTATPPVNYGKGTVTIVHDGVTLNVGDAFTIVNNTVQPYVTNPAANTPPNKLPVALFNVYLSGPRSVPVTFGWNTVDGTAVSTGNTPDFTTAAGTATIAPGQTSVQLSVTIDSAPTVTSDTEFTININPTTIMNADARPTVSKLVGTCIIYHGDGNNMALNPPLPIEFSVNNVTQPEGNTAIPPTPFVFAVAINQPVTVATSVNYTVMATPAGAAFPNPAVPNVDFVPITGTVTFMPNGPLVMTIPVSVLGNTIDNQTSTTLSGNRTFEMVLSLPTGGTGDIAAGFDTGIGTIVDDDAETVTFSSPTVLKPQQGTTTEVFTATLNNLSPNPVSFQFSTANNTAIAPNDYTAVTNQTVMIPANTISATFTVTVIGNAMLEGNTQFLVNIPETKVTGAYPIQAVPTPPNSALVATAVGTIVDQNNIAVSIGDSSTVDGPAGTTNSMFFTLYLNAATTRPVTVNYATQDASAVSTGTNPDYAPLMGTFTFAPGTTVGTITVTVDGQAMQEPNKQFTINLSSSNNAGILQSPHGTPSNPGVAIGTIFDDNLLPAVTVGDATVAKGPSGNVANAVFPVYLSFPVGQAITVPYATQDGTATATGGNYVPVTNGTVVIPAGQTTAFITVHVNGASHAEGNENFLLNVFLPYTGPSKQVAATLARQNGKGYTTAVGYIVDTNPMPTVNVGDMIVDKPAAGTHIVTFPVYMSSASTQATSVQYATADGTAVAGTNYVATSGTLVFPPGVVQENVTVTVLGNSIQEGTKFFNVNLSTAFNMTIAQNQGLGTIIDDTGRFGASDYLVSITPQSKVGTYSYAVGPFISDRIRTDVPSIAAIPGTNSTVYSAGPTQVGLPVPSGPAGLTDSTMTITGVPANQVIRDLTVNLSVGYPLDSHLALTLTAPDGTILLLSAGNPTPLTTTPAAGTSAGFANYFNTTFDDQASLYISDWNALPPYNGSFRPQNPLATLDGISPNGTWTLEISAFGDPVGTGTLQNWSLNIQTGTMNASGSTGNFMDQNGIGFTANQTRKLDVFATPEPAGGVSSQMLPNPVTLADGTVATSTAPAPFQLPYASNSLPLIIPGPSTTPLTFFPSPNPGSLATVPNPVSLNLPIPPAPSTLTPGVLTSTINISGVPTGQVITHLAVSLSLNHTQDSNLLLTLIAPDGTSVVLSNRNPIQLPSGPLGTVLQYLSGANFDNVTFDDNAPERTVAGVQVPASIAPPTGSVVSSFSAPYLGTYMPQSPLGVLDGKSLNGTWTLQIQNFIPDDPSNPLHDVNGVLNVGSLLGWSIQAQNGEVLNANASSADVTFDELINPATFKTSNVLSIMGPLGPVPLTDSSGKSTLTITPLLPNGTPDSSLSPAPEHSFRISFPTQTASGNYSVQIGPNPANGAYIMSTTGNAVDQNQNAGLPSLEGQDTSLSTTVPITYSTTDLPKPQAPVKLVPGGPIALMPITVPGNFVIKGAKVTVNIATTYDQALQAVLYAPDGTPVTLFTDVGTGPVNGQSGFQNTTLDDAATTPIQLGVTPFNTPPGSYNPQKPLSILDGKGSKGTWYLAILDAATVKVGNTTVVNTPGQITSWSLTLLESPTTNTGLGEPVSDQIQAGFQVFDPDPSNPLSTAQWTPVGPASISQSTTSGLIRNDNAGRISALAVDPSDPSGNTVYAGAASGGVWKTTNFMTNDPNGPNWVPLTDFGPTLSLNIGSIVVIPKNNDPLQSILIVGTGEGNTRTPGVGFLRSPDGGRTWQVLDSLNNVDPATGQVASINSPSRDHTFVGTTTFQIAADIPDSSKFPNAQIILYAAMGNTPANAAGLPSSNRGGIYRSTNLGNTWTLITAGDATGVELAPGSVGANGNEQVLYGSMDGEGVVFTSNAPVTSNMVLLPTPGNAQQQDNLIQNDFNYPLGPTAAILPVAAPPSNPSGPNGSVVPQGRITLALPKATGQPLLDSVYQSWVYALVATPGAGGTENGLYLSKDFGRTWTQIQTPILTKNGLVLYNTNDDTQPNQDSLAGLNNDPNAQIPFDQANYSMSMTVDPTNPSIVYIGGEDYGFGVGGLIRVDTTTLADPYNLTPYDNSKRDGGLAMYRTSGSAAKYEPQNFPTGVDTVFGLADPYDLPPFTTSLANEQYTGENPVTLTGGYVNLQRNPENPFITFSTLRVEGIGQPSQPPNALPTVGFSNTGQGAYWEPYEVLPELLGNNAYFQMLAVPDPMTGGTRLILATAQGVFTQEAVINAASGTNSGGGANIGTNGGLATLAPNLGNAVVVNGSRNGDIQVTQFFYGAVQPSELASELADSLFYGSARENGSVNSIGNVLENGNLAWTGPLGDATGVATDQTGSGTKYQYVWPQSFALPGSTLVGGLPSDFFTVTKAGSTAFSATNGLVTGTSNPSANTGLWPAPYAPAGTSFVQAPGGANFAINPVDGNGLVISSPGTGQANTAGWIFLTTTGGNNWFPIAQPSDTDSSYAQALAFGAPNPSDPTGSLDNIIYAGTTGGHVYVTFTGGSVGTPWKNITGGAFGSTGALDGSAVQEIVTDPNRGSHDLYAITLNGVYYMADSTAANPTWVNLTGNLFRTSLSKPIFNDVNQVQNPLLDMAGTQLYLSSLAVDWRYAIPSDPTKLNSPTHPILYVAGEGGVFRSLDNGSTWSIYPNSSDGALVNGGYLPNVHVTDLSLALGNIDPSSGLPLDNTATTRGTGFNMLVASTYGRGQFEIRLDQNATVNGVPISKYLVSSERVQGPYVASAGLVTNAAGTAVTGIDVTFSGAVDPTTFTVAKIKQIIGPAGNAITPLSVIDISTGGTGADLHNMYEITFAPQTAPGTYTVTFGPNITDFGGNAMDQNRNGVDGEAVGDDFSAALSFGNATPAPTVPEVVARIQNNGQWWVGTPNGTNGLTFNQFGQWAVDSPGLTWVNVHTGDFLGNGTQDIVGMVAQTGQWWVGISNGDHFTNELWATWAPYTATFQWQDVVFGDFNGDGKMDIAGRQSDNGRWWVALSTGSSFQTSSWGVWAPQSASLTWSNVVVGDFNGDGKTDIAGFFAQAGQWWVAQSTGSSFTNKLWATWAPDSASLTWGNVVVGDFTGNGKADIAAMYMQTGQWWMNLSSGSSFTPVLWDTWSPAVTWVNVQAVDVDGSGRAAIVGRAQQYGSTWVSRSTGTKGNTSLWAAWGADALGNVNWETDLLVADLNGDGKKDLIGFDQALDQWWVSLANGSTLGPRTLWASFPGSPSFTLVNVTTAHVR